MRVASIQVFEHQRLLDANGSYGDGIVLAEVNAPRRDTWYESYEYLGVHYTRRADGTVERGVWG
jgi:hypothetical protein